MLTFVAMERQRTAHGFDGEFAFENCLVAWWRAYLYLGGYHGFEWELEGRSLLI